MNDTEDSTSQAAPYQAEEHERRDRQLLHHVEVGAGWEGVCELQCRQRKHLQAAAGEVSAWSMHFDLNIELKFEHVPNLDSGS